MVNLKLYHRISAPSSLACLSDWEGPDCLVARMFCVVTSLGARRACSNRSRVEIAATEFRRDTASFKTQKSISLFCFLLPSSRFVHASRRLSDAPVRCHSVSTLAGPRVEPFRQNATMQARGVDYARERPPTRQIYSTIPAPSFHAPTSYPGAQTHSNPAWSPLPTPHHAYPLLSAQYPYHNSSTHSWTAPRPTQTQTQHFPRQFLESPKSATEPNHPVASNSLLRGVLGVMPTKRRRVIVKLPIKGSSEPEAECGGVEGLAAGGIASTAGDRRIPLRGDDRQEVARKMDVDEFRFATERATTRGPHRDELRQVQLPPTIDMYVSSRCSSRLRSTDNVSA